MGMVRLLSLALYLLSEGLFLLGAGRECEGTTQRGQGEGSQAHIPPIPFRFFPHRYAGAALTLFLIP